MFNLFCKHEWKVISEMTEKSFLDKFCESDKYNIYIGIPCGIELCGRIIQIITCLRCGKIKKFVERF